MNRQIINKFLNIYCFFTLAIIVTIKYDYIYLSTILGLILIMLIDLYNIKNGFKISDARNRIFKIVCYIYCIYTICITLINYKPLLLIYSIHKIIPLILCCKLITYLNEEEIKRLRSYCCKLVLCIIGAYIILLVLRIAYVELGINTRIMTFSDSIANYSEYRFSGMLSHKSRFGIFCILVFFIIAKEIGFNKEGKFAVIALLILSLFSNSITTSIFFLVAISIYIFYKNIKPIILNFKKGKITKKQLLVIFMLFIIVVILLQLSTMMIATVTQIRDFSTLGSRLEIWQYAVEYIKNSIHAAIRIPDDLALQGITYYNNAHNLILNEAIETGIFGSLVLTITFILTIIFQRGLFNKIIFLCIFIAAQFDKMISNEVIYMYWLVVTLYINKEV